MHTRKSLLIATKNVCRPHSAHVSAQWWPVATKNFASERQQRMNSSSISLSYHLSSRIDNEAVQAIAWIFKYFSRTFQ